MSSITPVNSRIQPMDEPPDRAAARRRTPANQEVVRRVETGQAARAELITERNVTEVSMRMELFGLEYRKIQTVERQYAKSARQSEERSEDRTKKAAEQEKSETIEAEVIEPDEAAPLPAQVQSKLVRAYLPNPSRNDPMHFQA